VVRAYPDLADDAVWQAGVRRAVALWTVDMTVHLLPRTVRDEPMHRTRRPVPTRRQLVRHRWESAIETIRFPALTETLRLLLDRVAGGWDVPPLPGYPAFGEREHP
jgi:hypothetical protein